METTTKLDLKIVTEDTFEQDDIKETIINYGKNFSKLEKYLKSTVQSIEDLNENTFYATGHVIWNKTPAIGSHIGWVATREGIHAKSRIRNKDYVVGELIKAVPDNGGLYECVVDGRSSTSSPTYLTGLNQEFYDTNGTNWRKEYNYEVGDIIYPTNGNKQYYYICETAGLSSTTEPEWTAIQNGITSIDGSVVWRKAKTIKWKRIGSSCEFRPFGKIE
ncbi:hypothetical protein LYSIN_02034 [Lysinibacillus sphaericus]|uniref:Uncharacterized protein n=1 Tax=Lysinibacillus sphaericus TaxID=1421 RepID=A0A2S5D2D6_LYSSH|nr:hypothetical protein [Lysinibacillus sphaericus]POZ57250.1 hypothetical protein LYSIN_02034 [Lysinibacillus sphaericus]